MKGLLLVVLIGVLLATEARGQNCLKSSSVAVQAVVTQAVAVSPVAVVVPVYSAVYQPQAQAATASDEVLKEILAELKAMREELASLKTPVLALGEKSEVIKTNCVSCHGAAEADRKGGGFALFTSKGELAKLGESDKKRIVSRVSRNSMPPPEKKISAADKQAVLDAFK